MIFGGLITDIWLQTRPFQVFLCQTLSYFIMSLLIDWECGLELLHCINPAIRIVQNDLQITEDYVYSSLLYSYTYIFYI